MIGFIALGIVMLIWVLTWEPSDGADLAPSQGPGPEATA